MPFAIFKEGSSPLGRDLRTQFHALKPGNITLQVQGYYQSELIESQKFEVDVSVQLILVFPKLILYSSQQIRKYPFGPRADLGGKNLYTWVFFSLSTAYYYLFLPLLVILAVLIGTVGKLQLHNIDIRFFVLNNAFFPCSCSSI